MKSSLLKTIFYYLFTVSSAVVLLLLCLAMIFTTSNNLVIVNAQQAPAFSYVTSISHTESNFRQIVPYTDGNGDRFIFAAFLGSSSIGGVARYRYNFNSQQYEPDSSVTLSGNELNPTALVLNGNTAFLGCEHTGVSRIAIVNIDTMSPISVFSATGTTQPFFGAVAKNSKLAIFAAANGGAVGDLIVVDTNLHNHTVHPLNQSNPRGILVDGGESNIFVSYYVAPGIICRIRMSDFVTEACLTLNTGEDLPVGQMAAESGNLYVTTSTAPARIVKIAQATLTRVSGLILNTGEDNAMSISLDIGKNTGYIGTNTNDIILVSFDYPSMSRLDSRLSTGGFGFAQYSLFIPENAGVYFSTATYPGALVHFGYPPPPPPPQGGSNTNGGGSGSGVDYNFLGPIVRRGSVTSNIPTTNTDSWTPHVCASDNNGKVFTLTKSVPGQAKMEILDVSTSPYTVVNSTDLDPTFGHASACARDFNGGFFFAGKDATTGNIKIGRFIPHAAVKFLYVEITYTLPSTDVTWMTEDGGFLYLLVRGSTKSSIVRLDVNQPAAMVPQMFFDLPNTISAECRTMSFGSNNQLYVISSLGSPSNVFEVKDAQTAPLVNRQLDIAATLGTSNTNVDYRIDGRDIQPFLFVVAQGPSPPALVKIDTTTFTVVAHGFIGQNEGMTSLRGMLTDGGNNVAYFVANRGSASLPSMFIRVNLTTIVDYVVEYTYENNGLEFEATDCGGVGMLLIGCIFPNKRHFVAVERLTYFPPGMGPTIAPPPGEITPIVPFTVPTKKTNISDPPPFNIEEIEGNTFYPLGYVASSCNNTNTANATQKCMDDFHTCYGNKRFDLGGTICPLTLGSCIVSYSKCLLTGSKQLVNQESSCPWGAAFLSAGMDSATSAGDLYDCAVFVRTFAFNYFNCFPMIPEICGDVVGLFAAEIKNTAPAEINQADLRQTTATKFPRGMLPIVVSKNETSQVCTRPYFDASCRCPLGFKRMRLYEPSYLFATANETEKKKASNYDICYDRSVPQLENVSFDVVNVSLGAGTNARRADGDDNSESDAQCSVEGQTLRELKVLAENSAGLATGRILAVCAPRDTNIFILNSMNGGCYSPRVNVSCSCGVDATSIGVPITYLNESTNVASTGVLIICNFPLPPGITTEQAVTLGVTASASVSPGPSAQGLQAAAVSSLLDCQSEDSEAQQQGGRFALVPVQIGDTEAAGMIFLLITVFGTFLGYGFVCAILAFVRYNSCCCNYCSGHDKAPEELTANPKRIAYFKLLEAHRQKKAEKKRMDREMARSGVFEREESISTTSSSSNKNNNKNTNLIRKQPQDIEPFGSKNNSNTSDALEPAESLGNLRQETSNVVDAAELAPALTTIFDAQGNAYRQKKAKKTVDEKLIITYVNDATGEEKKKKLKKKFKYAHLDNKKLGFMYHFWTACATLRYPGFFYFVIFRFFFQGLAYESFYLISREDPSNALTFGLGIFGTLLTLVVLVAFIAYGRALQNETDRLCDYSDYKHLYKNWPSMLKTILGPDGCWPDNPGSYRHGLAWDDFSGNCRYISIAVPMNYIKAALLAVLTAPPWPSSFCSYIYYILIALFFVFSILVVWIRPYRFFVSTFTDAFLGFLTGLSLLYVVAEWDGVANVYSVIVYSGLVLGILNQVLGLHEFAVGFCVEVDDDEEDNLEDWMTDSDNDDDVIHREKPKLKELVDEFRDDAAVMDDLAHLEDQEDDCDDTTAEEQEEASAAFGKAVSTVYHIDHDDADHIVDKRREEEEVVDSSSLNQTLSKTQRNNKFMHVYVPTPAEEEREALGGTLTSMWTAAASLFSSPKSSSSASAAAAHKRNNNNTNNNAHSPMVAASGAASPNSSAHRSLNATTTSINAPDEDSYFASDHNNNHHDNNYVDDDANDPLSWTRNRGGAASASPDEKPIFNDDSSSSSSSNSSISSSSSSSDDDEDVKQPTTIMPVATSNKPQQQQRRPNTTTTSSTKSWGSPSSSASPVSSASASRLRNTTTTTTTTSTRPSTTTATSSTTRKPPTFSSLSTKKMPTTASAATATTLRKSAVVAPSVSSSSSSATTTTKSIPKPAAKKNVMSAKKFS